MPAPAVKVRRVDEILAEAFAAPLPAWGFTYSIEFFPPRTEQGLRNLEARFERMLRCTPPPLFGDVTWGAGGSTADSTLDLCEDWQRRGGVANMHLTCTNMPVAKLTAALSRAAAAGIRSIVALRGDPPQGADHWGAVTGGFSCALDLVRFIRTEVGDGPCICVAGYPEAHPDALRLAVEKATAGVPNPAAAMAAHFGDPAAAAAAAGVDVEAVLAADDAYLKRKVAAGAQVVLTQMFLDARVFLDFVARCRREPDAIPDSVPILPGIMVFGTYEGFKRMVDFCRIKVPAEVRQEADSYAEDHAGFQAFCVRLATRLCQQLRDAGVRHFHFYTLNTEVSTWEVLRSLGVPLLTPSPAAH